MANSATRRRFIAGAVCPRCALMDKIVVDLDSDQRICVNCGFSEQRPADPGEAASSGARELATRVSRAAARRVETPAQPVTLIEPEKPAGK